MIGERHWADKRGMFDGFDDYYQYARYVLIPKMQEQDRREAGKRGEILTQPEQQPDTGGDGSAVE